MTGEVNKFVDARSSQLVTGRDIDSATKTDINSLRYSQSGFPAGRCALCIQFIYRPQMGASLLQEASLQLRHTRQSPLTRIASLSFRPPLPRRPRNNDASFIAAETTEPLSETADSLRYSRRLGRLHSCTPTACQSVLSSLVHIHPTLCIFFRSCTFQSTLYTFFRQCPILCTLFPVLYTYKIL